MPGRRGPPRDGPVPEVAADFDVSESALRRWMACSSSVVDISRPLSTSTSSTTTSITQSAAASAEGRSPGSAQERRFFTTQAKVA
jgi:hypothetical protein